MDGKQPKDNNTLKNAPHTQAVITSSEWNYPYSREQAAYPAVSIYIHRVDVLQKFVPCYADNMKLYGT